MLKPLFFTQNHPVAQYELGRLLNFVYLILDWKSKEAAIIDPEQDIDTPLGDLAKHGFKLTKILLTHTHHDHVAGVPALLKRDPKLKLYVHKDDAHRLGARFPIETVQDGDSISVGSLTIQALHTPGHSQGEITYYLKPYLFTGDTVFIRDCGRTDLETGSTEEMFRTLQRLKTLPPETIILPGHHYQPEFTSTLAKELKESPPFQCRTVEELAALP